MRDIERDIYKNLITWKMQDSGRVLELSGARQVGKTYILTKFAKENYRNFIYINMLQASGGRFLECLDQAEQWKVGMPVPEHPLHQAFLYYAPDFSDTKDTIVVVDEIQESSRVFSLIRQFSREFECHFAVTGSYLGKTMEKGYFFSVGDVDVMTLNTLSFGEFLGAWGKRDLFEQTGLYGESDHAVYDELKKYYHIYSQIGGYPAVVNMYIESGSFAKCEQVLHQIVKVFLDESGRYFKDVLEVDLLERLLPAIAQTMVKEKKGSKDLITDLTKLVFKEESNRIMKKSINSAIAWFYHSHVIGYCGMVPEGNIMDMVHSTRFYFMDIGIGRYFLNMAGADPAAISGLVSETFVYRHLKNLVDDRKIAGAEPLFGIYKEGEIDFFVNSRVDYCNYAVEVKSGNNKGRTATQLLKDGKVSFIYYLKGDTYGGVLEGKVFTTPIYLTERVTFDKGN